MRFFLTTLGMSLLVYVTAAHAYPSNIGYGYESCRMCHFNPLGNGPLTDYGRALAAVELSDRLFLRSSDDELGKTAGFFGPLASTPPWLALEARYRGNYLVTGIEKTAIERWIHMQAEGSVVLRGPDDTLFATVTVGYTPVPATVAPNQRADVSTLISREHYVGFRPAESWGVYAGFMDIAFGIRVPDHNAYLRSKTFLNMNDQSHGLLLHANGESWDGALHLFGGNLFQEPSLRQKGVSLFGEVEVRERWRLGASVLASTGTFRSRQMAAVHSRTGLTKGSSVLAEIALIHESPVSVPSTLGSLVFLQASALLSRGFYLLMTFEHFCQDFTVGGARYFRVGPGLQYFPMQRLELRADFLSTRTTGQSTVNPDIYTLMSQVHVWL